MRDMLDSNGATMQRITVLMCRPLAEANVIRSRTLTGSWHVQTVGDPSWKAEVQVKVVGTVALLQLQEIWALGLPVTVRFDGEEYTGLIEALPKADVVLRLPAAERVYKVSFALLITSEVV